MVTFLQFTFIAIHGLIFTSKFFTVKRKIPMRDYMIFVAMFFSSSVCNNYSLNFNIPMPLHMIFKSGLLMANMIMGIVILNKSYDSWKYFSVGLITFGLIICTIITGSSLKEETEVKTVEPSYEGVGVLFWWSIGILLMTSSLFLSARIGIFQEALTIKYGKHPHEMLFFTHILSLPGFLFMFKNIYGHSLIALQSESYQLIGIEMPIQILYLVGNVLTQYLCVSSVYVLNTECTSLTVTLVLTLRKFVSLLFSVIYFKNSFTLSHWIGTFCVFIGTVIFTEIIPKARKSFANSQSAVVKNDKKVLLNNE